MTNYSDLFHAVEEAEIRGLTIPCRVTPGDLWFSTNVPEIERAKDGCRRCPVVATCGSCATHQRERWGVWGGRHYSGRAVGDAA